MTRTRWAVAAGVVALAGAGGAAAVSREPEITAQERPQRPVATAEVDRRELAAVVSLDGTLTYRGRPDGSPYVVVNRASGTYTDLPDTGDEVGCGEELHRVDDRPVLLLCGTVPAYRALRGGDEGRDVRQLNRSLRALGYAADAGSAVFTWTTEQAVRALQEHQGVEVTGVVEAGDVVVLPRPVRIAAVDGVLGGPARAGTPVARATSRSLEVQVGLDPSQPGAVREGDAAQITLPGSRVVRGEVARIGRVVTLEDDDDHASAATIPASIRLRRPAQARGLDRAPVQVEIATEGVRDALSVPVTALVGRSGGGFAVEVVRDGGRRELVAVRLGLVDGSAGRVEVRGGVAEGDDVVIPAS